MFAIPGLYSPQTTSTYCVEAVKVGLVGKLKVYHAGVFVKVIVFSSV
jgi:hypothetical protein